MPAPRIGGSHRAGDTHWAGAAQWRVDSQWGLDGQWRAGEVAPPADDAALPAAAASQAVAARWTGHALRVGRDVAVARHSEPHSGRSAASRRVATARRQARGLHRALMPGGRFRPLIVVRVPVRRWLVPQLVNPTLALPTRRQVTRHLTRAYEVVVRTGPLRRPVGRLVTAAAVIGCVALAASGQHTPGASPAMAEPTMVTAARQSLTTSRSAARVPVTPATPEGFAAIQQQILAAANGKAEADAKASAAAKAAADEKAQADAKAAAAAAKWKADNPTPVAGLTQTQMNNALRIVGEGKALGLPKRAYVLAVACAMQESGLRNLASDVLPESYNYPHEGNGSDHDSVGLFQQRPSSGWGSVKDLMTPAFAAKQFYDALVQVPGWQGMALTYAIQAVQVSAYPDAYAPHAAAAQAVVDALT